MEGAGRQVLDAARHTKIRRDDLSRRFAARRAGEESPDRKGHFTAESADGSNLVNAVTENNRILRNRGLPAEGVRVKT